MSTDFVFLGHNAYLIEEENNVLLIDPWLDEHGAFFGSWHQWPANTHLKDEVMRRCASRSLAIFITHEHQDHFDVRTLAAFADHADCTVFIPSYRDKYLRDTLASMRLKTVELQEDEEAGDRIRFRIFIDDTGINHDSVIFVSTARFTFFNQNDCKIFERLAGLKERLGRIDYYSVQFSGANWHPVCFVMPDDEREQLSRKKTHSKFVNVQNGIRDLSPAYVLPSAGPAFFPFLDSALSTDENNIFVHQDALDAWLRAHGIDNILYPRPGDSINPRANRLPIARPSVADIEGHRRSRTNVWESIPDRFSRDTLIQVLEKRLDIIRDIDMPANTPQIVFRWGESADDRIVINLVDKALCPDEPTTNPKIVVRAEPKYFYLMCDGRSRWADISLTLRARVERNPDIYNTAANLFLFSDASNLRESLAHNLSESGERIVIEHQGRKFEINRFCPHQGADLSCARVDDDFNLICPRHSWKFDLSNAGICKSAGVSIAARKME